MAKRLLITTILASGVLAFAAAGVGSAAGGQSYCDPLNGCASLKLSPARVAPGHATKVYGSVAGGCQTPGALTVYSRAFAHATRDSFAGVPAIYLRANRNGNFSGRITISHRVKAGRYHVGGRCGGGNFGSATLRVT